MKIVAKVTNPDQMMVETTIVMTLGEWKKLKAQVGDVARGWVPPLGDLLTHIQILTGQAEERFTPKAKEEEEGL